MYLRNFVAGASLINSFLVFAFYFLVIRLCFLSSQSVDRSTSKNEVKTLFFLHLPFYSFALLPFKIEVQTRAIAICLNNVELYIILSF